ncbi:MULTISPECIES: hypothetical protein [unclassified Exiguobacterium]|uniref:hypothetical protein n=1 Tax=unclassified Exiguobacterium TaxID=2644629 RepID=UPI0025BECD23|nr:MULTISPECIES: hypothetical protein [unclassified Exiguobacterium]
MIYKNGWRVREVQSPVRKEQKIMEGNMAIKIGSVYQMTGEFKDFQKYNAVCITAIRRDQAELKFQVVLTKEEHTISAEEFEKHFTSVDKF